MRARGEATPALAQGPTAAGERGGEEPIPRGSAEPEAPPTIAQRARRGEAAALSKLEALAPKDRSRSEALAIGHGRLAKARADVVALGKKLKENPALLEDKPLRRRLVDYGRDESLAPTALSIMSELPGEMAADLLYYTWTGVRERTEATRLAQALVFSKETRSQASPALRVALDLRSTKNCEKMIQVLQRTKKYGDRRAVSALAKLTRRRGCGAAKRRDCYPCLRKTKDLAAAMRAAASRPAPRL